MGHPWLWIAALIATLALGLGYQAYTRVDRPYLTERLPRHEAIVAGDATFPYRYRVLVPLATEPVIRAVSPVLGRRAAFLFAYLAYDVLALGVSLFGLAWLLGQLGHRAGEVLAGATLMAALVPLTLQNQWYQPWSLLEPGLLAFGMGCALRRDARGLLALTVLACLNDERGIYLPLAALLAFPRARSSWTACAAGLAIVLGLRLALGSAAAETTFADLKRTNTNPANLRATVQAAVLLLGPLPLLTFAARRATTPLRRAAWIVPLHLALVFAFGVWHEGRLWMSLYPILIPLAWQALFPPGPEPERKLSAAA